MRFAKGDTVEVTARNAWTGEVGVVDFVRGPSVYVRFPDRLLGRTSPMPFQRDELQHSQQKLDLEGRSGGSDRPL